MSKVFCVADAKLFSIPFVFTLTNQRVQVEKAAAELNKLRVVIQKTRWSVGSNEHFCHKICTAPNPWQESYFLLLCGIVAFW